MGYRIHAELVFRSHPPFLARWDACGTYTDGKIWGVSKFLAT